MANFNLFSNIEQQFETLLGELKNWTPINIDRINLHIEYIKDNMELRIESLKSELEMIYENYKNKLNNFKDDLINFVESQNLENKIEIDYYEKKLKELKGETETNKFNCKKLTQKYDDEYKKLSQVIQKTKTWDFYINFDASTEKLNERLVGKLVFKKNCDKANKEIKVKLENLEYETIGLTVRPDDICVLPNKSLLCANSSPWNLTLYDENLTHLRTIDQLDNKKLNPLSVSSNNKDKIFIARQDEIIMTDLNFNKIQSIGSKGSGFEEFNYPSSICYNDDYLYVSDRNNKRIQKLHADLYCIENFLLNYRPDQIKVAKNTACIRRYNINCIYIYDLESFAFKFRYDEHNGVISEINSIFYECDWTNAKIYCYDENGLAMNEIANPVFKEIMTEHSLSNGKMVLFNNCVILTDYTKKSFIKFK